MEQLTMNCWKSDISRKCNMYININLKLRGMKINFSGPFIISKIKN